MKYDGRELEIGEKVKIFSGKDHRFLGVAKYKGDETGSPCFILNGKEIYGPECWWIPMMEANEIEKEQIDVRGTKSTTIIVGHDTIKITLTDDESKRVDDLVKKNYSPEDYKKYVKGNVTAGQVTCAQKHIYVEDWNIGYRGFKAKGSFFLLDRNGEDVEDNRWQHSWVTLKKEGDKTVVECDIYARSFSYEYLKLVGIDCSEFYFLSGPLIGGFGLNY